jgi:hypothetical protein
MLPAAALKLHGVRPEEGKERRKYGGSVSGRVGDRLLPRLPLYCCPVLLPSPAAAAGGPLGL